MKKLLFVVPLLATLMGCCKKDETLPSRTELLANKRWKLTALRAAPASGGPEADIYDAYVKPCSQDNFLIFDANSVLYYDDGPTQCKTNDDQRITGTWAISADEKRLSMQGYTIEGVPVNEVDLESITATQMVIAYTYTDLNYVAVPLRGRGTLTAY